MATGRTVPKFIRIYAGHEATYYPSMLCGLTRTVGPLMHEHPEIDATGMCDSIKGYLPGQATISPGTVNVIMDPAAANTLVHMLPGLANGFVIGSPLITQIPIGIRAAPAMGDPVFGGVFPFLGMQEADDGGLVTAVFQLGASWATDELTYFGRAWGQLLHAYGQETGANSSSGADGGAASTNGGLMLLNIFSSDAAACDFKVQHSTDNSSFSDLTGASISVSGGGAYSYYALVPKTTTVNRYLRWQMTAAKTNTFVMSFIRG